MAVDMKALLALPQKERRKIAEKLFDSLQENNSVIKLSKKEKSLLEKRWQEYMAGQQPGYTPKEMRAIMFHTH